MGLLSLLLVLLQTVFSHVLVNSAGRVDKLLLAGVERMAGRTDVEFVVSSCGFGANFVATCTREYSILILGMYIFFQFISSSRKSAVSYS